MLLLVKQIEELEKMRELTGGVIRGVFRAKVGRVSLSKSEQLG